MLEQKASRDSQIPGAQYETKKKEKLKKREREKMWRKKNKFAV